MKTQEFEHLRLFVMRNTFESKNINSESDISAVIVIVSWYNEQIKAVRPLYKRFASVPLTENVVNIPLPK